MFHNLNLRLMKKQFKLLAMFVVAATTMMVSSCSNEDLYDSPQQNETGIKTRSTQNSDGTITITFDDFDTSMMAGPTSKGENYYSYLGATPQVIDIYDPDGIFGSSLNTVGGYTELSSGGIALSNWSYQSNIEGKTGDWWYSWDNQCSVYNTDYTGQPEQNIGHSGSNFGVVYGYTDSYNEAWMAKPEFYFDSPRELIGLWICNSSYTYGVIEYGNSFGATGTATPLKNENGYFQVNLECYGANNNLLTTKTFMLADYRDENAEIDPITKWTYWEINVKDVQSVKFNFDGSDKHEIYGLNTPAYICIDDITIK